MRPAGVGMTEAGYTVAPRGCGGIGRRARFRSVWASARGGSSPLIRMRRLTVMFRRRSARCRVRRRIAGRQGSHGARQPKQQHVRMRLYEAHRLGGPRLRGDGRHPDVPGADGVQCVQRRRRRTEDPAGRQDGDGPRVPPLQQERVVVHDQARRVRVEHAPPDSPSAARSTPATASGATGERAALNARL